MKLNMARAGRPAPLTDKTYELLLNDTYRQEELSFYNWVQANWEFGDDRPLERQRMERILPDMFQQKEQSIVDEHAKHKRRAILNILGPDTREDFLFLYQCAEDDKEKQHLAKSNYTPIARRFYNVGAGTSNPRAYTPLPKMENFVFNKDEHVRLNINNSMNFDGLRVGVARERWRDPYKVVDSNQPNGGIPIWWNNFFSSNPGKIEVTTKQQQFPPY